MNGVRRSAVASIALLALAIGVVVSSSASAGSAALPRGGKVVATIRIPGGFGGFVVGEGAVWAIRSPSRALAAATSPALNLTESARAARSLTLTASAQAEVFPELNRWASVFAMRQVTVQCPGPEAWRVDEVARGGWAYVPLGPPMTGPASHTVAAPLVCAGALAVAGRLTAEPWQMALGVLTLLHEAYHLRIWKHWLDEGRVNCQAIRHFKVGVRLLSGSRQLADDLLPYALSIYWRLAVKAPAYHRTRCRVPSWSR